MRTKEQQCYEDAIKLAEQLPRNGSIPRQLCRRIYPKLGLLIVANRRKDHWPKHEPLYEGRLKLATETLRFVAVETHNLAMRITSEGSPPSAKALMAVYLEGLRQHQMTTAPLLDHRQTSVALNTTGIIESFRAQAAADLDTVSYDELTGHQERYIGFIGRQFDMANAMLTTDEMATT